MYDESTGWEGARSKMLARWRRIAEAIDRHDEGEIICLANAFDEFCEEAIRDRWRSSGDPAETRCRFCRAFEDFGGCFGILSQLNKMVRAERWDEARRIAFDYLHRLEQMSFPSRFAPRYP